MNTATLLLLMVGFLAAQGASGSLVPESQLASILSLLGLSGLALLTTWLEREVRPYAAGKELAGAATPSAEG
jgi:hypothetical protein